MNKRRFIIISVIILIILLVVGIILYIKHSTINNIKYHYNKYIFINNNTKLYDNKKNIIGKSYTKVYLELDRINNINISNKYFRVRNSNIYIYYKDTNKSNSINKDTINSNYSYLDKSIKSNKSISLYSDNGKYISTNNINLPILYIDNNKYYVYYLNRILYIKKDKDISIVNNKNSINTRNVSILLFNKVSDKCNNNYNCILTSSFKDIINKIKDNGYNTINNYEYSLFINNNINIKNKSILIMSNSIDNNLSKELGIIINSSNNIKLNINNKTNIRGNNTYNAYSIKSYSSMDNILKMCNGEDVVEVEPIINKYKKQGVPVLNYHFFYDPKLGEECNEGICLTTDKFRDHLEYLKNNGYKTLTMDEFVKWIYGEIDVPDKSVLITVDDGAMGTGKHNGNKLIPILEEYNMHATLFLISGWWNIENYRSPNLEIQSHTYDMHKYGECMKGQLVCANYNEAKADLQKSLDIIGDNKSFCYPFYSYDNEAIQAVKDLGFKVAFVGGMRNATRSSNKYLVPRYPIHSNITLDEFIKIVS